MGEIEDDFGDLYADVELQVSASISTVSGFNQLYLGNDKKSEIDGVDDPAAPELNSKKVNSITQESTPCGKDGVASKENGELIETVTETSNSAAHVEEEQIVDSGSDSEDDLHIVLNEEDCRMNPVSRNAITGNRRLTEGSDDEDDDLVIVTNPNRPGNDRNLLDQLPSSSDGLEQTTLCSGAKKGNGINCSHLSQYAQYKYVRRINSKGSRCGAAVHLSTSLPGKCDWDVNGSNHKMASSSSTAIPFVAQRGYDFSLPRHRTILDIDIDSFERKPWSHPGADITDFFNFGLDEETWKEYSGRLEQFRQQTYKLAKPPESLRLNQASGLEYEHETVAPETVAWESDQIGNAMKSSLSLQNGDRGGRWPEVPKGRAIQVEGGIGERQPSMDVRRPRSRDSDVVIQIAVHDPSGDSSCSSEQGHEDNLVLEKSKSRDMKTDDIGDVHDSHGVHKDIQSMVPVDECCNTSAISHVKDYGACHLTRCSTSNTSTLDPDSQVNDHISDEARCHHQMVKEKTFKDEKLLMPVEQTEGSAVNEILSEVGPYMEAESNSEPYLDGCSKESNDELDSGPDRAPKALERPSLNSTPDSLDSVASDSGNFKGPESNDSDMESGECKFGSEAQTPNHVKQNCRNRIQLCSVAELKDHSDDDEDALMSEGEDRYGGGHSKVNHNKRKQSRRNNGAYDGEDLSYYGRTEVSSGYRSERSMDRKARNDWTENFHGIPRHGEDNKDRFPTRKWHENDYFLDPGLTAEYRKREDYLHERGHTKDRTSSLSYKKSRSLSEHSYLCTEEARNPRQRRKNGDPSRLRTRTPDDDYESEDRYTEELREKYGRHVAYNGKDLFKDKYDRHIPYMEREIERSGKRNRYCRSPHPDLEASWNSSGYDDGFWRQHPDRQRIGVDACREVEFVNERRLHDITSPRNDTRDIRGFDERHFNHQRPIKHRDGIWLDPMYENDYHAEDMTIYPDADIYRKGRRFGRRSETFHWDEGKLCSRLQDQEVYSEEEPFIFKRYKKQAHVRLEHEPRHHGFILNERVGSKIIREEIRISEVINHNNSGVDFISSVKHEEAALRSRDSTLSGWEGKSGRCSKAADVRCSNGKSRRDWMVDNEQLVFRHSDEAHTWVESSSRPKADSRQCKLKPSTNDEKWLDKYPVTQYHEASDLEEGQLAEEPEKKETGAIERKCVSGIIRGTGDVKGGKVKIEDSGNEGKGLGGYDNHRILETMAKMEKRRERFKEAIPLKESCKNPKPEPASTAETEEIKQERPLRKRRWA